jgi:hypothetical protein
LKEADMVDLVKSQNGGNKKHSDGLTAKTSMQKESKGKLQDRVAARGAIEKRSLYISE